MSIAIKESLLGVICFIKQPSFRTYAAQKVQLLVKQEGLLDRAVADAILHRKRNTLFVQRRLPILLPLDAQYLLYFQYFFLRGLRRIRRKTKRLFIISQSPAIEKWEKRIQKTSFFRRVGQPRVDDEVCHVLEVVERIEVDSIRIFRAELPDELHGKRVARRTERTFVVPVTADQGRDLRRDRTSVAQRHANEAVTFENRLERRR
jgi:hypothetical protein